MNANTYYSTVWIKKSGLYGLIIISVVAIVLVTLGVSAFYAFQVASFQDWWLGIRDVVSVASLTVVCLMALFVLLVSSQLLIAMHKYPHLKEYGSSDLVLNIAADGSGSFQGLPTRSDSQIIEMLNA